MLFFRKKLVSKLIFKQIKYSWFYSTQKKIMFLLETDMHMPIYQNKVTYKI